MPLVCNSKFAVAQRIPQLDRAIAGSRDDLTIIGGEGDGEDIVGVAYKASSCSTSCKFPKAESFIPGGGEGVRAVGGNDLADSLSHSEPDYGQVLRTQSETIWEWPCKLRFG